MFKKTEFLVASVLTIRFTNVTSRREARRGARENILVTNQLLFHMCKTDQQV